MKNKSRCALQLMLLAREEVELLAGDFMDRSFSDGPVIDNSISTWLSHERTNPITRGLVNMLEIQRNRSVDAMLFTLPFKSCFCGSYGACFINHQIVLDLLD